MEIGRLHKEFNREGTSGVNLEDADAGRQTQGVPARGAQMETENEKSEVKNTGSMRGVDYRAWLRFIPS